MQDLASNDHRTHHQPPRFLRQHTLALNRGPPPSSPRRSQGFCTTRPRLTAYVLPFASDWPDSCDIWAPKQHSAILKAGIGPVAGEGKEARGAESIRSAESSVPPRQARWGVRMNRHLKNLRALSTRFDFKLRRFRHPRCRTVLIGDPSVALPHMQRCPQRPRG